jgi:sulfide dehydrogenase [flavocytochrome c] flavoprotein subunit
MKNESSLSRRALLKTLGVGSIALTLPWSLKAQPTAKVVIAGGGFGGVTVARYLRRWFPLLEVTLVEPNEKYYACPFSNLVVAGIEPFSIVEQDYASLKSSGVRVVHQRAEKIDGQKQQVVLSDGAVLPFDRAVVSPGVSYLWNYLEGYSAELPQKMPAAWSAGPTSTLGLKQRLAAVPEGGTVLIVSPPEPYKCPVAPYERAGLFAHYLSQHNPTAKVILLDQKDKFSKQQLFMDGWARFYGEMIEWRGKSFGGEIFHYDAANMQVETEFGEEIGDLINLIPPQQANRLAHQSELTDETGWCPVNPLTFESTRQPKVHVIGDACYAGNMPKSAFSANNQGKVTAAAIGQLLQGEQPTPSVLMNTCYSFVTPEYCVSEANVYEVRDQFIQNVPNSGGVSPVMATEEFRALEARYAYQWYHSILHDTFLG